MTYVQVMELAELYVMAFKQTLKLREADPSDFVSVELNNAVGRLLMAEKRLLNALETIARG